MKILFGIYVVLVSVLFIYPSIDLFIYLYTWAALQLVWISDLFIF